ncbi:hypothetical protein FHR99_001976 [Litorivivens lipolytica]|uniref:DUF3805 domain-containing protein n=1 Tax=Litorivivens lipolytica TaxID=1524264 RepID=A0A7W4W5B6_9GAMM|nr:hypothetical protein [Litorivivens lipolytica]MBB3047710.1 hypothetical protein [Litorivivens lipolytica]
MRELETDWWFLSLPEDWQVDQDDDSIVITDPDEVGVITLTSLITDGERDIEAGLKDLMASLGVESSQVESTMLGDFDGYYQEFQDGDDWVREWYLGSEHCLLLVSYDCDPDNKMMDRELVDDILDTLSLKA